MRVLSSSLASLLVACGSSHPRPPDEGDARIVTQVLDRALTPEAGMTAVAQSGGWPIRTSRGYVVATVDEGLGPYVVESPSGGFADTTLEAERGIAWALVTVAEPLGASLRLVTRYGDPVRDPWTRRLVYPQGSEVALVEASGPHLERWPGLVGQGVLARTVRVWVTGETPTHVLYANDGQNLFDPRAAYSGWQLQAAAAPTTLLVGIDNTSARFDDYTPVPDDAVGSSAGGHGAAYADFVELTVRPFIEARYGAPARVGVMGSSLGGLISLYEGLRYPGRYDFVGSMSGTVGWGSIAPSSHEPTIIEDYAALAACPAATFYVDSGGSAGSGCVDSDGDGIFDDTPDAGDNYCENVQLADVMRSLGCGDRLHYVWGPGEPHNEASWRGRAPGALAVFEAL